MKTNYDEHLSWYKNTIQANLLAPSKFYTIYKADDPSTHTTVSNNYTNNRDSTPPISSATYSKNTTDSTTTAITILPRKRPLNETSAIPSTNSGDRPAPMNAKQLSPDSKRWKNNTPPTICNDLDMEFDDLDINQILHHENIGIKKNLDIDMKEGSSPSPLSSTTTAVAATAAATTSSSLVSSLSQSQSTLLSTSHAQSSSSSFTVTSPIPQQSGSFSKELVISTLPQQLSSPPTQNLQQKLDDVKKKIDKVNREFFREKDQLKRASLSAEEGKLKEQQYELEEQIKNQNSIPIDLDSDDDDNLKNTMDIDSEGGDFNEKNKSLVPISTGASTKTSPYFSPSATSTTATAPATTTTAAATSTTATPPTQQHEYDGPHSYTSQSLPAPSNEPTYPWSDDVRKTLQNVFKLAEFRTNQLEAINTTMNGEDVFVLMPTGGGKSLCYQLPATLQQGIYGSTRCPSGVTVVVSPLLSLMIDQVDQLQRRGIRAERLDSTIEYEHRQQVFRSLNDTSGYQQLQLIYVTPEMITKSGAFQGALERLSANGRLARFVIDEAHCVSQWGHDFRPDYKLLKNLKTQFPSVPLMALTATATPRVQMDVLHNLGITGCKVFKQSFNRPNLKYEVIECNRNSQKKKVDDIYNFITTQFRNKCGIIYCPSRDKTEWMAGELQQRGVSASFYHAGMASQDRSETQMKWQQDIFQVVVATVAFGMGIDKPDVRFVVHFALPLSVEGYYQETGRAGRDGKSAICRLYYSSSDTIGLENMIRNGDCDWHIKKSQFDNLQAMVNYCRNQIDCRRKLVLAYFGESFDPSQCAPPTTCDTCLNRRGKQVRNKDWTTEAKQYLQLYQQLNFNNRNDVTLGQLTSVFRGSNSQTNRNKGYTTAANFGIGRSISDVDVKRVGQHLCSSGYLQQYSKQTPAGYTCTYVTFGAKAHDLLSGQDRISLPELVETTGATSSSRRPTATTYTPGTSNGIRYNPPQQQPRPSNGIRYNPPQQQQPLPSNRITYNPPQQQQPLLRPPQPQPQQQQNATQLVDFTQYRMNPNSVKPPTTTDPPDVKKLKDECFEKMRNLRNELKRRHRIQMAKTIFTDGQLGELVKSLPCDKRSFIQVTAIDNAKFEQFGQGFLKHCREYSDKVGELPSS